MVQQVTSFRTTTGKAFDTEFEAWGEELRDFLVKNGADNDAIARKIVQAVADGQPETLCTLADIVENMHRCAPPAPVTHEMVQEVMDEWDKDSAVWNIPKAATIDTSERPCKSPVACSRNHYGICSCYSE